MSSLRTWSVVYRANRWRDNYQTFLALCLFTLYLFLVFVCFWLLAAAGKPWYHSCFFWCIIAKARDSSNKWILLWNLKLILSIEMKTSERLTRVIVRWGPLKGPPVLSCWPSPGSPSPSTQSPTSLKPQHTYSCNIHNLVFKVHFIS